MLGNLYIYLGGRRSQLVSKKLSLGWAAWTRTRIYGSKVRCAASCTTAHDSAILSQSLGLITGCQHCPANIPQRRILALQTVIIRKRATFVKPASRVRVNGLAYPTLYLHGLTTNARVRYGYGGEGLKAKH